MEEIVLKGGNVNRVIKKGATVRRPVKNWSISIQRLLQYIRGNGFMQAPEFLGLDEEGREILTFLPGEVAEDYPLLQPYMREDRVIASAALLLRRYHDATVGFPIGPEDRWMLTYPGSLPQEVICHNDFSPYNVLFTHGLPSGVIDFDCACPGPRIWDIAYTLYTFIPLEDREFSVEENGMVPYQAAVHAEKRRARLQLFFEAYGLTRPDDLMEQVILRIESLCTLIETEAANGNAAFQRMILAGDLEHYRSEIVFIKEHAEEWQ
jgi:hypothetical protein